MLQRRVRQNSFSSSMRRRTKTADRERAAARSLTGKRRRELAAIAALPDEKIDTSDIPELPASAWKDAVRGRFYRPVKQAVSLRLAADVSPGSRSPAEDIRRGQTISSENGC